MSEPSLFVHLPTGIESLDDLLPASAARDHAVRGIACHPSQGFFAIIRGAAGSGKSILALQMCFGFVEERRRELGDGPVCAVYVSQENPAALKARVESSFERFNCRARISTSLEDVLVTDVPTVVVLQLARDSQRQQELLDDVFRKVKDQIDALRENDPRQDTWKRLLVCLDNADAISPPTLIRTLSIDGPVGDAPPAERDANFLRLIRHLCAQQRINTCLVFEEYQEVDSRGAAALSAEAYGAEILLQLGVRQAGEFSQRYLEIVKSRNQYYFRGRHDFSIHSVDRPQPKREAKIKRQGGGEGATKRAGRENDGAARYGCQIYPSMATQLAILGRKDQPSANETAGLGIEGRDGLRFEVQKGTCTVLVSDINSVTTPLALDFARLNGPSLYISFLHTDEHLKSLGRHGRTRIEYFPPEHIGAGKLLHDVTQLLGEEDTSEEVETVVIDNIFELRVKYPLVEDPNHFIAALLELFRSRGVTSLIVDTIEADRGKSPIERSLVAGFGDNLFALRTVDFQSRPHSVLTLHKTLRENAQLGDWHIAEKELPPGGFGDDAVRFEARATFDSFKNVALGLPQPVTLAITLYHDEEDGPFGRYLKGMAKGLERTYGKDNVSIEYFGPDQYPRMHNLLHESGRRPLADCHILALDETWLDRMIAGGLLDITPYSGQLREAEPFVTAAHDLALVAWGLPADRWYAVPMRNNVGVLCSPPGLVAELSKEGALSWSRLRQLKTSWKDQSGFRRFLLDEGSTSSPLRFFTATFDQLQSIVCLLLELRLAVGAVPMLSDPSKPRSSLDLTHGWREALELLFDLLDDDDIRLLASGRTRPSRKEPRALFSRQWLSSIGELRMRKKSEEADWFSALSVDALPVGSDGQSYPVSGAWYMGILGGSAAARVGVEIIQTFRTVENELYQWNERVGGPVSRRFYAKEDPFGLPYRKRFYELGGVQADIRRRGGDKQRFIQEVLQPNRPFYRSRIEHYERVALIVGRMIREAACARLAGTAIDDAIGNARNAQRALDA